MHQIFQKKKSLVKSKQDKGQLSVTLNEIYDIVCDDVFVKKRFVLAYEKEEVNIQQTLVKEVFNNNQSIKLKFQIISKEDKNQSMGGQKVPSINQQIESNNSSFNEGDSKAKVYEFEINLKQMFEQCQQNKGLLEYKEQVPYYEQYIQSQQSPSKKDPQGFAYLTFRLVQKMKQQDRQNIQ